MPAHLLEITVRSDWREIDQRSAVQRLRAWRAVEIAVAGATRRRAGSTPGVDVLLSGGLMGIGQELLQRGMAYDALLGRGGNLAGAVVRVLLLNLLIYLAGFASMPERVVTGLGVSSGGEGCQLFGKVGNLWQLTTGCISG